MHIYLLKLNIIYFKYTLIVIELISNAQKIINNKKSKFIYYQAYIPGEECTCGYRISASGGCSCGDLRSSIEGYSFNLKQDAEKRLLELMRDNND